MHLTATVLNLKKLPKHSHVWEQLFELTEPGWYGLRLFELIRKRKHHKRTAQYYIYLVYDGGKPVAWGMRVEFNSKSLETNLYLYTKPLEVSRKIW